MLTILAIIFMTIANQAITLDGKEVLLSEQDMTWQYANKIPDKQAEVLSEEAMAA